MGPDSIDSDEPGRTQEPLDLGNHSSLSLLKD